MKQIIDWIRRHPLLACFFTAVITFFITAHVLMAALRDPIHFDSVVLPIEVAVFLAMAGCIYITRSAMAIVVAASLLVTGTPTNAQEFKQAGAYLAAGLLVIVGGIGIVGCRIIKKCNRIGRHRATNMPPEEIVAPGEIGAYFGWGVSGYCEEDLAPSVVPVTMLMCVSVYENGVITTASAFPGWQHSQTFEETQREAAEHGLFIPNTFSPSQSFERDGKAAKAENVPITFNRDTRTVTYDGGGALVTVWRSGDLKTWERVLSFNMPIGETLRFEDVSEEQQFYRIEVATP